jgi:glycosyltransferase involved in cell wall biosynthesis
MGRLTLGTYGDDPTLRALIDVVPFGRPDRPIPPKRTRVIKGVIPGIGDNDRVLLWAGSILDWQDPQLLIRAVARLRETRDDVKLVFMGTRHPNPGVPPMRAVPECIALADALGVARTHVFFNDWVAYGERHEWLLEADLGVSTHRDHLETHFSFRTRMLDYFWAGLPMVATRGDVFADEIDAHGLGLTVAPGDEVALAAAIARMLDEPGLRDRCAGRVRERASVMTWNRVAIPLARFCADPRQAADRLPQTEAFHRRLRRQFRLTKWLKRTAVRAGVSDARIDQLKQTALVRHVMALRNRRAYARARRG